MQGAVGLLKSPLFCEGLMKSRDDTFEHLQYHVDLLGKQPCARLVGKSNHVNIGIYVKNLSHECMNEWGFKSLNEHFTKIANVIKWF